MSILAHLNVECVPVTVYSLGAHFVIVIDFLRLYYQLYIFKNLLSNAASLLHGTWDFRKGVPHTRGEEEDSGEAY